MADTSSNEDTALRFVLGELNDAERREFESLMAMSAELRALVNELETGVVAMANAAPRRRAPAEVWRQIEKAMVKETRPKLAFPSFWFGWLRNGWAVAVLCLIGWLFYAFSVNRHLASAPEKLKISQPEVAVVRPVEPQPKPVAANPPIINATNAAFELLQARMREILELRGKIAQLETARTQLSLSLAQQHALLGESNRIKFYHLSPISTVGTDTAPLSPGLQRAVFMALARELGWLPVNQPSAAQAGGNIPPTSTTIGGVDFVELRPGSQSVVSQPQPSSESGQPTPDKNATTTTQTQPQARPQTGSGQPPADNNSMAATPVPSQAQPQTESSTASSGTTASSPTIPAYVSGNDLVVALDSTIVPTGSLVSLSALDANQNTLGALGGSFMGSFMLGNNPTVVTMPFNLPIYTTGGFTYGDLSGFSFVTMNFQTPDGQTGTIQFYVPPPTHP